MLPPSATTRLETRYCTRTRSETLYRAARSWREALCWPAHCWRRSRVPGGSEQRQIARSAHCCCSSAFKVADSSPKDDALATACIHFLRTRLSAGPCSCCAVLLCWWALPISASPAGTLCSIPLHPQHAGFPLLCRQCVRRCRATSAQAPAAASQAAATQVGLLPGGGRMHVGRSTRAAPERPLRCCSSTAPPG